MKKTLLLLAIMLCCAMTIFAQNNRISYQAVVRDTENKLVANKSVQVTVNIYNGTATTAAYTETQTATTNLNGLVSLLIGNGTVTDGNWGLIDWKTARIETTVTLAGTSLGTLAMPLTAVPYAMYAEYADELDPDAAVVIGIYNKILYDSLALGALIDANAANIGELQEMDEALSARITVDSNNLVIFKAKVKTDSATLRDLINTNAENISELQGTDAALSARITADSNKLVGFKAKMKTDSATLRNLINTNAENISELQGTDAALSARITSDSNNLVGFKAKVKTDSTILANRITTDSTALVNRIVTDSTALHKAIKDTANAIRGDLNTLATTVGNITVNDPAITLKNGSTNLGSFTLNQASASEIDLSSLTPDLSNYATLSGNNTYTGTNDFTGGTTKVASGFTMGTTTTANCGNVAVNACDLLAVFDSLSNRIQGVFDSLKHLNDSLANELEALKNTIPPTADAPTIKNLTSTSLTVKANNTSSGAAITSYEYCYSTNSDMSGATCQTSALDTLDLTGLTPNTDYYVTVKATNFAGSTTSSTTTARTPAHAPTATVSTSAKPAGFKVEVTGIDPKEKTDATTVQVCYKQSASCSVQENYDDYTCADAQSVASGITTNTQTITDLAENTAYCVIVKVSNGDSTTIYGPTPVTTGANVTLSVAQTGGGTISLCDDPSVNVIYTATITGDDASDFTYTWSTGTSTTSKNTVALAAGTHTITVTATHATEGYTVTATASTTVNNGGGTAVSIGFCEYEGVVSVVVNPQGSPNSISWGDGQSSDGTVSTSTMHDYTTTLATGPHEVTITASNSDGCIFSRTMTVNIFGSGSTAADRTVKPCSVGSHAAQTGSTYTGNGHSGANHGLETVNGSGKITSVTDYDGNAYPVVQIGNQCWLAENLRVSHSPKTGSNIVVNDAVNNSGSKMAVWYNNDQSTYEAKRYGLLYNWCAAMDTARPSSDSYTYVEVATAENTGNYFTFTSSVNHQGVCPTGWHVPTVAEWNAMEQVVNGSAVSGTSWRGGHAGKLSTGCDWSSYSTANAPGNYANAARNSSGFSAVPAGYFYSSSTYAGNGAFFWSTTPRNISGKPTAAYSRYLYYNRAEVNAGSLNKGYGCSVRCVRD